MLQSDATQGIIFSASWCAACRDMSIAQLLNQNSFLLVAGVALGGALIALIARRARPRLWLVWIAAVAVAVVLNRAARTTPARAFESAAEVERAITSGTPTLVELYSNY